MDVARAHAQRRDRGDAIAALLEAERIAPEQIRDHPKVRVLVRDLLQDPGWRSDQDQGGLADRCGVVGQETRRTHPAWTGFPWRWRC